MRKRRQLALLLTMTLLHVFLVFGPLVYLTIYEKMNPPKPEPFRVKLGGLTPSHAPEVGPPERTRGPAVPEPVVPEPVVPEIPAPEPVAPEPPAPEPVVPEPAPAPPPVPAPPKPKPHPKKTPKKVQKKAVKKTPKREAKKEPKKQQKPQTAKNMKKRTAGKTATPSKGKRTLKELQREVYRPAGGGNTNINVPFGTRDRGQKFGPQDNKTPMGGATPDMERYWKVMRLYLYDRWKQPPKSLLGNAKPTAEIELRVSPDGRVLASRLLRGSGNAVMDDSVRNLLKVLDRIPAPPDGELNFTIELVIE